MQLIFQVPLLATQFTLPAHHRLADFLQRGEVHHLLQFFAAMFVCGQITGILSIWVASKAVAEKDGSTLVNALKLWFFTWVAFLVIVAGLYIIVPSVANSAEHSRVYLVVGGLGLLYLMLLLLIPTKVYGVDLPRSVGILLLAGLINCAVASGLSFALSSVLGLKKDIVAVQAAIGKTPAEQRAFGQRLMGEQAPDEIDRLLDDALHPIGPQPPSSEREAMVRTLQQKLSARQKALKPGDAEALAAYQAQLNRYLTLRNEVLAERNGQPAAAP